MAFDAVMTMIAVGMFVGHSRRIDGEGKMTPARVPDARDHGGHDVHRDDGVRRRHDDDRLRDVVRHSRRIDGEGKMTPCPRS